MHQLVNKNSDRYMDIEKGMTRFVLLQLSNLSSERGGQYRDCSTDSNTECGKLHAQTSWGDMVEQNKDLLSMKYVSEMRPCSATGHQIGYD